MSSPAPVQQSPEQLPLLTGESPRAHLVPYWRYRLDEAVADCFYWRHAINTTAWSTASGSVLPFSRFLFQEGEITAERFRRYRHFYRHLRRWVQYKLAESA